MMNKKAKRKINLFGQMKILLSFIQVFASMPNVLDSVPWPPIFVQISFPLGFLNFDIIKVLSASSCLVSVRFFDRFILHVSIFTFLTLMIFFHTFLILLGNKLHCVYLFSSVLKWYYLFLMEKQMHSL